MAQEMLIKLFEKLDLWNIIECIYSCEGKKSLTVSYYQLDEMN